MCEANSQGDRCMGRKYRGEMGYMRKDTALLHREPRLEVHQLPHKQASLEWREHWGGAGG